MDSSINLIRQILPSSNNQTKLHRHTQNSNKRHKSDKNRNDNINHTSLESILGSFSSKSLVDDTLDSLLSSSSRNSHGRIKHLHHNNKDSVKDSTTKKVNSNDPILSQPDAIDPVGHSIINNFSSSLNDVYKSLIFFYCNLHKITCPTPVITEFHASRSSRGKKRNVSYGGHGHWSACINIPHHENPLLKNAVANTLNTHHAISIRVTSTSKKNVIDRVWKVLASKIAVLMKESELSMFRDISLSPRQRIRKILDDPITIDIDDASLEKVESHLNSLENLKAFENVTQLDRPQNTMQVKAPLTNQPPRQMVKKNNINFEPPPELYKNKSLPMFNHYSEIMRAIENNPVVILSAETGAGKTTQLPQFILAHAAANVERPSGTSVQGSSSPVNIIVTQPRRIAAISVAQRVASERGEVIGKNSAIGYQVRFEEKRPSASSSGGGQAS